MKKEGLRAALYARCSTHDKGQDPELQLAPLREYCERRGFTITEEYVDNGISGSKDRRPQLDRLMDVCKKRQVDCIVVWRLDRWGRSLKHLINSLSELEGMGVSFISYSENLDLSTSTGKMMFHLLGAFSEFERSLTVERVRAGLDNARRKGKVLGRKPLAPVINEKAQALRQEGLSYRVIAKRLDCSIGSVHKSLSNSGTGTVQFI